MKKSLLFLLFLVTLLNASHAHANFYSIHDKPYMSLKYLNVIARPISQLNTDLSYQEKTLTWGYLPSFALAVGYSFGAQPVRIEAEISGLSVFSDIKEANLDNAGEIHNFKSTSFVLGSSINLYLDHEFTNVFSVYTGGGIGTALPFIYARSDTSSLKLFTLSGPVYQWNLTAGATVKIDRNVFFDFGYRYVDLPSGLPTAILTTDLNGKSTITKDTKREKFNMSQITLGVRCLF